MSIACDVGLLWVRGTCLPCCKFPARHPEQDRKLELVMISLDCIIEVCAGANDDDDHDDEGRLAHIVITVCAFNVSFLSLPSPGRACGASWHTLSHHLVYPPRGTAWLGRVREHI